MTHSRSLASPSRRVALTRLVLGMALFLVTLSTGIGPVASSATGADTQTSATVGAQDNVAPVQITLDQVSPTVARPGQAVTVTGSIKNVSKSFIDVGSATASTQSMALDTAAALDAWLAGDLELTSPRQMGKRALSQRLSPGEMTDFSLLAPADTIAPEFAFASLPLLVTVTATEGTILGSVHTVLPWYATSPPSAPLQLSWVVPLTVPPEPTLTSTPGPDHTQAWLDVVGAGSVARSWLDGLEGHSPTFVIDPALLVPSASAADISAAPPIEQIPLPTPTPAQPSDPSVSEPSPSPVAPTSDATASSTDLDPDNATETNDPTEPDDTDLVDLPQEPTLIQEAEAALQNRLSSVPEDQLWWLPVADPDLAALVDVGVDAEVVDDVLNADLPPSALQADALVERGRHDVGWPAWSLIDDDRLDAVTGLGSESPVSTLVVPRSTFSDGSGFDHEPVATHATATEDLKLLGYDERLSNLVASMPTSTADAEQIQAVLAYTLARYQRTPADPGAVVIAPARDVTIETATVRDLGAALGSAPWLTEVPATMLLNDATEAGASVASFSEATSIPTAPPSPLSLTEIDRIEEVRDTLAHLGSILRSAVAVQRWEPVLNGLYSTRWRTNPDGWSVPLSTLESQIEIVVDGVTIKPTAVNFLAQEGLIQITIDNDLPVAVQDLQLTLSPGNGRLRIIDQPSPISIGPKSRANVQFRARAVAAGEVPVRATLATPSGLMIGDTQDVDVQVRPTGIWIYWVLGGVAGMILILGLTRALRRPVSATKQEAV